MVDMTEGRVLGHLTRYALPVLLASWLQLMYNAVDSIIAGRFIGRDALAAEGIAGPVMNLIILFINGLCIGSGVLMSEAYGRKDYRRLLECSGTLILVGTLSSLLVTASAFVLSPFILKALRCPEEIASITNTYLRIIFLGTPFTFLYNAFASSLKSVGDSRTPLLFLAFSSILNAVLDLVFLGIFRFGITCSAVTTVVAEAASCALSLVHMMRKEKILSPSRGNLRFNARLMKDILIYGGPAAVQQAIQPVGKVLIQGSVNALGVSVIAAYNASTRVDDFACIPEQGIAAAISTFTAQNRGAGKKERIRDGFRCGLMLGVVYWAFIAVITFTLRRNIISLFVSGENASAVISTGEGYLKYMALFYLLPALTNGFQGFYRGMGKIGTTALGTFIQTGVRTLSAYFLAPVYGIKGIAFSCAAGWILMLLFEIPYYFTIRKKKLSS